MLTTRRLMPLAITAILLCIIFYLHTILGDVDRRDSRNVEDISSAWSIMKQELLQQAVRPSIDCAIGDYQSKHPTALPPQNTRPPHRKTPISYDKSSPPTIGCEDIVLDLQRQLVVAYTAELKGIRYANIFGYLETENKGDAVIWTAQQILLSTLGITSMEACRFIDRECDLEIFKKGLAENKPHSAILMAGGGNFNDFYHTDHQARIKMVEAFKDWPIRAFPQSIHMSKPDIITKTKDVFNSHTDLHLAARDKPSFRWLQEEFGKKTEQLAVSKVKHILVPDIAFMFGSRPDLRINAKKTHQILILAREDKEVAEGNSTSIPSGTGALNLGELVGNVTYLKIDWESVKTPNIDIEDPQSEYPDKPQPSKKETGKNQRAFAKAIQGFEMLASADLVITDRLHGHIMASIIGVPHVLMDSKLKKNLNFHDTWTKDCGCTRISESFDEAMEFAKMFFSKEKSRGGRK